MPFLPESGSIEARLREIVRRLQLLERADRLGSTAYRAPGRIRFLDAEGNPRFNIGRRQQGVAGAIALLYFPPGAGSAVILGTQLTNDVVSRHGLVVFDPADAANLLSVGRHVSDASADTLSARYAESGSPSVVAFRVWPDGVNMRYRGADAVAVTAFRSGGEDQLVLSDPAGGVQVRLNSDGMARPRLPVHWADGSTGDSVDTGTFTTTAEGYPVRTHPTMRITYRVVRTGSPTIEVRLRDTSANQVIGGPWTHSATEYGTQDVTLLGDLLTPRLHRLEARVSAGTGSARVTMIRGQVGSF